MQGITAKEKTYLPSFHPARRKCKPKELRREDFYQTPKHPTVNPSSRLHSELAKANQSVALTAFK